jgi:hypothetical protein
MGPNDREGRGAMRNQNVIVSWVSALPVKQALFKSQFQGKTPAPGDPNYTLDKPDKDYVIAVSGLRMPGARRRSADGDEDGSIQAPDPDNTTNSGRPPMDPAQVRDRLLKTTRLSLGKNKLPIEPEDVKLDQPAPDGTRELLFFFPRTSPLSLDDKEVTFETQMGPMKIERKFALKDMRYQGKLEL